MTLVPNGMDSRPGASNAGFLSTLDLDGIGMIWQRDLVRFWRQKTRLLASVVRSAIWLFALGIGLRQSFVPVEGYNYLQFIFPGIIAMAIVFSAVQSAISIVWDREFGFLKEILVAPIPRSSIIIGKVLGSSTTSIIQGLVILCMAPLVGVVLSVKSIALALAAMFLIAVAMSSLGILIAVKVPDFESFGSLQNLVTMPMYLLSGAIFPAVGLPVWFTLILLANPLTYGVDLLRGAILGIYSYNYLISVGVLAVFSLGMVWFAVWLLQRDN